MSVLKNRQMQRAFRPDLGPAKGAPPGIEGLEDRQLLATIASMPPRWCGPSTRSFWG